MAKIKISKLGKTQLKRLRSDIILNSLFIDDYKNRYEIDPHIVCDFFDGYMSYLGELEQEKYGKELEDIEDFYKEFDNIENLWDWYCSIEWTN